MRVSSPANLAFLGVEQSQGGEMAHRTGNTCKQDVCQCSGVTAVLAVTCSSIGIFFYSTLYQAAENRSEQLIDMLGNNDTDFR